MVYQYEWRNLCMVANFESNLITSNFVALPSLIDLIPSSTWETVVFNVIKWFAIKKWPCWSNFTYLCNQIFFNQCINNTLIDVFCYQLWVAVVRQHTLLASLVELPPLRISIRGWLDCTDVTAWFVEPPLYHATGLSLLYIVCKYVDQNRRSKSIFLMLYFHKVMLYNLSN